MIRETKQNKKTSQPNSDAEDQGHWQAVTLLSAKGQRHKVEQKKDANRMVIA